MINWIHGHTSDHWPVLSQSSVFVELSSSLQDGLFGSSSTSNQTNCGSAERVKCLPGSRGKSNSCGWAIIGMPDNCGVAPGCSSKSSLVSRLLLQIAHDGTLGHLADRQHVPSGQSGLNVYSLIKSTFGAAVNVLACVGTFRSNEQLGLLLVLIGVPEFNFHQWSSSAWIVEDRFDDPSDIAMSFRIIEMPVLRISDSLVLVGLKHTICLSLSLSYIIYI